MSAPERIWTRDIDGTGSQHPCWSEDPGAVCWVRKDASDAAIAAARVDGWNAAINAAADEAEEHKHFAKGIECCAECIRKMARPEAQP